MLDAIRAWLSGGTTYRFDFVEARRRCRILIIDDDPNALPLIDIRTGDYNITQERVVTPDLLRQCEEGLFDIIILDYNGVAPASVTPDDGFGVFSRIKDANPDQYIIAISAQTYDISKTEYFQHANDWLRKPTDLTTTKNKLDAGIRYIFDKADILRRLKQQLLNEGIASHRIDRLIERLESRDFRDIDGVANTVKRLAKITEISAGVYSILKVLVHLHVP
jgi:CheY-like chemotaxis protein